MKILLAVFLSLTFAINAFAISKPVIYVQKPSNWKGRVDLKINPLLPIAANIATKNAEEVSIYLCWKYVKQALLDSGVIKSRPKTLNADQAGNDLVKHFGFYKLPTLDPYAAPIGAVIVYTDSKGKAGHVELRARKGFVSDFFCMFAISSIFTNYKVEGIYAKK